MIGREERDGKGKETMDKGTKEERRGNGKGEMEEGRKDGEISLWRERKERDKKRGNRWRGKRSGGQR